MFQISLTCREFVQSYTTILSNLSPRKVSLACIPSTCLAVNVLLFTRVYERGEARLMKYDGMQKISLIYRSCNVTAFFYETMKMRDVHDYYSPRGFLQFF